MNREKIKKILVRLRPLLILLAFLAAVGIFYLVDLGISKSYLVEVVSIPAETKMGETAEIRVRVTKGGVPQKGHLIAAYTYGKGSYLAFRLETDGEGYATFTYYTLKESRYNPVADIPLAFKDESNSVVIEVNASVDTVLHMVTAKETA